MKTTLPKVDEIEHHWYVINAEDAVLGRLSTKVAKLLRGKHKPAFTPFFDMGDFVIILNAEKVKLQVKKNLQKNTSGIPVIQVDRELLPSGRCAKKNQNKLYIIP